MSRIGPEYDAGSEVNRRLAILWGTISLLTACRSSANSADVESISTTDVHHFVTAFASWTPKDTACRALEPYWRTATRGLRSYANKFDVADADLCRRIRQTPARYARLATLLPSLDSAAAEIRGIYAKFDTLHPLTNHPAVYFVVGNGISGGSTTRGRHPVILIGTELLDSARGVPRIVAHELVHTQQDYPFMGSLTGGPTFLRGSLLRHSITEGSADFIASLLLGRPFTNTWAESHEDSLWAEFQRDAHSRDYRRWLYNGWNRKALGDRPPDLGYWMGYRITQAYYDRARDKRQAITDILSIRDFDDFLKASGYRGDTLVGASAKP